MSLERKRSLLDAVARKIVASRQNPLIFGGKYQRLQDGTLYNEKGIKLLRWPSGEFTQRQTSPLVGRISIRPGLFADRAYTAYSKNDCMNLSQLYYEAGWNIPARKLPEIIKEGDALTLIAPWPTELQTNEMPLTQLHGAEEARRRGRLVVGADTAGDIVTFEFDKIRRPGSVLHLKLSGTTGAGKSVFERSLIYQISDGWRMAELYHTPGVQKPQVIIIDMKGGDGPGFMRNIPCLAGPVVMADVDQARDALFYAVMECQARYRRMEEARIDECTEPPLYVVIGEVTKLTADKIGAADKASIFMLAYLMQMARAANVHVIVDTQYSKASYFGETATAMQFDGYGCFATSNEYDTGVALPRGYDVQPWRTLTLAGDGYFLLGDSGLRRALVSYVPTPDLNTIIDTAEPALKEWPEFDAEALEGFEAPNDRGRPTEPFTAEQIAAAMTVQRMQGDKRRLLRENIGSISNSRARELFDLARELDAELNVRGYCRPSEK